MADGRHIKIVKSPYLNEKWSDSNDHLVHYSRYWTRLQSREQELKFFKIQDGDERHLKFHLNPI